MIAAIWYGLSSTQVVYAVVDSVLPATKTIVSADVPCAHHDCGCQTAEQCRTQCCCFPKVHVARVCVLHKESHVHKEPVTVKVSYLSALRCRGHGHETASSTVSKLGPHLPPSALMPIAFEAPSTHLIVRETGLPRVFQDPPEKIPIEAC